MYKVIEFNEEEGGGLAIVHTKWLTPRKKEVFWPPYKDNVNFMRALKRGEEIDEKTWQIYGIARHFYESDNLDKSKEKQSMAEVTSDINTEAESNLQSRKRSKPKRYLYDSSSEEEQTDCTFERPAKISNSYDVSKNTKRISDTTKKVDRLPIDVTNTAAGPSRTSTSDRFDINSDSNINNITDVITRKDNMTIDATNIADTSLTSNSGQIGSWSLSDIL